MSKELNSGHRDRLRQRFLKSGLDGFHDYEIIELLLTLGTPRKDCKPTAKLLLKTFGSLKEVLEADPGELEKVRGVGPKNIFGLKIAQAVARRYLADRVVHRDFIRSSADVLEYLTHSLRDRNREVFMVIYLNNQNQILKMEELFEGTLTSSVVYPREVVKQALAHDAAALVFVHNHPSGNPAPSKDDLKITEKLKQAAGALEMTVYDHIIIAGNEHYSFAEKGLI